MAKAKTPKAAAPKAAKQKAVKPETIDMEAAIADRYLSSKSAIEDKISLPEKPSPEMILPTKKEISDFIQTEGRQRIRRRDRANLSVSDLQWIADLAGEKFGV